MNEKVLIRFITFAPIVVIPTVVALFLYINISHNNEIFYNSTKNLKEELILKEKNNALTKVKMAIEILNYEHSTINKRLENKVQQRVNSAFMLGSEIYNHNKDLKNKNEIKHLIIDALRTMVWNNGESFIFILDKNGISSLAPEYLKNLEGKSIIDFKDATGRYIIQEEINLVNTEGEGFLWNTFTRANRDPNIQFNQMTFVKDFKIFDWYLGSSEYLDITKKEIENRAISILRNVNKNSPYYFFIFDTDGNIIMHSQNPEFEEKNFFNFDDKEHKEIAKQFSKTINSKEENTFVSYIWKNPKNGVLEEKISYFEKVPQTNWMIGSGFYTKEINDIADLKKEELKAINERELYIIKLSSAIFILLSLFVALFISKKLQKRVMLLKEDIESKSNELLTLNEELEYKIEQRTLELQNSYDKMRELANTDSLTKINNRHSFLKHFNSQLKRSQEFSEEFSLIMIDIDYFKNINDTYGHNVGDIAIIEITEVIKECLREHDIFGRIGGEEFMVLFINTPIKSVHEIAQRIRKTVDEHTFKSVNHITVSIGVVSYKHNEESKDILRRVDIALYEAKNSGRNRVCISE